ACGFEGPASALEGESVGGELFAHLAEAGVAELVDAHQVGGGAAGQVADGADAGPGEEVERLRREAEDGQGECGAELAARLILAAPVEAERVGPDADEGAGAGPLHGLLLRRRLGQTGREAAALA